MKPETIKKLNEKFDELLADDEVADVGLSRLNGLLDCPSCGCDQIHIEERNWVVPFARYCRNCRMYGPAAKTLEEADALWNALPRSKDTEGA